MIGFITKRLQSFGYAFKGIYLLVTSETNSSIQLLVAIVVTIAGFVFKISTTEWIAQIFAIALVMSLEGINTAIEKIVDFVHPEHHQKIGHIKDIAAGAVLIAALAAITIGGLIYLPKLF